MYNSWVTVDVWFSIVEEGLLSLWVQLVVERSFRSICLQGMPLTYLLFVWEVGLPSQIQETIFCAWKSVTDQGNYR